jgi:hypothetical protein
LDQTGYLDYNTASYTFIGGEPTGIGGSSTFITVNAWVSKSDEYYDLGFYLQNDTIQELYGQKGYPIISPALRNAYYFLYQYPTDGFEVYKPDRLAVWILPMEEKFLDAYVQKPKVWEFKDMPLMMLVDKAKLVSDWENQKFIILNGRNAQFLYDYLGNLIGEDIFYRRSARWK